MWKYTIEVNGMMCGMCGVHINDAVRKAFPVKKVTSSRGKKQTVVLSETELKRSWIQRRWRKRSAAQDMKSGKFRKSRIQKKDCSAEFYTVCFAP